MKLFVDIMSFIEPNFETIVTNGVNTVFTNGNIKDGDIYQSLLLAEKSPMFLRNNYKIVTATYAPLGRLNSTALELLDTLSKLGDIQCIIPSVLLTHEYCKLLIETLIANGIKYYVCCTMTEMYNKLNSKDVTIIKYQAFNTPVAVGNDSDALVVTCEDYIKSNTPIVNPREVVIEVLKRSIAGLEQGADMNIILSDIIAHCLDHQRNGDTANPQAKAATKEPQPTQASTNSGIEELLEDELSKIRSILLGIRVNQQPGCERLRTLIANI